MTVLDSPFCLLVHSDPQYDATLNIPVGVEWIQWNPKRTETGKGAKFEYELVPGKRCAEMYPVLCFCLDEYPRQQVGSNMLCGSPQLVAYSPPLVLLASELGPKSSARVRLASFS